MNANDFQTHPTICLLPWHGIYVNPDGEIKNCAISGQSLGNIHDVPLSEMVDNDVNRSIKKDMINGVKHQRCKACYNVEDNAPDQKENESNRTWYKKIAIKNLNNFDQFDKIEGFSPQVLDLRWRNTCNYACVYCGPDLSSVWAKSLNLDYSIDETVLKKSKSWILDNIESVNHVYLAGGEPLLIKENQDLLAFLLEKKPEVEIRINSNLSNINTPVFRQLIKFKNVKWTISVDSQKDCFEYMRWPGSWKNLLSNLKTVQNIAGDQINFNMVWCILNDIDILDTIDFLLDFGFHENMFIVQCLTTPFPLSILNLPKNLRTDLKRKIQIRQQTCNPDWWLYKSLQSMYNFLDQEMPTKDVKKIYQGTLELHPGLEGTFKYLEFIDNLRNLDSKKLFARLYQLR